MVAVPLLVLGARFAGLTTALFLAHQGFPVHVIDRDRPGDVDRGLAVLTPAALRELAALGLADPLAAQAWEPRRLAHADADTGAVLRVADLGPVVRARFGRPYLLAPHGVLRALLVAACAADEMVTVTYGRSATSVEDLGDAVLVTDDAGGRHRAEAVIGADGAGSRVRAHLGGGHALSSPYLVHRGPGPAPPDDVLRLWSSPTLHVTQSAVAGGGGEVSMTVRVDALEDMHRDGVAAVVARLLASAAPEVRAAVGDAVVASPSRVHRHHAPLERGARHRLTVVGGAAQPMLPHTAQAVALEILDAATLGRAFDHADGRIVPALEEYASVRAHPRAAVARRAHDFAALCHADGLVRRMRDRLWRTTSVDATAAIVDAIRGPSPGSPPGAYGHRPGLVEPVVPPAPGPSPPGPHGPAGPIAG
ncbi:FAD-dependent monooxygenase [Actinomycetospora lutea]|uniref:FAD-dependent monooxygenase n=1 Tax=Actinomycetospora lutea TaxID=663604 RepID=UPI002367017D|nr:FAD-dependent monooxygenase [Actinomycetospora lutea]MDD7938064.1 FAD-dependent monooxygenase [Actinomycetospora lutea]